MASYKPLFMPFCGPGQNSNASMPVSFTVLPTNITSIVTDCEVTVDPESGAVSLSKTMMTQENGCWVEATASSEVVSEDLLSPFFKVFKAGSQEALPDFNGLQSVMVLNADGTVSDVSVIGGGLVPDNMIGSIVYYNGDLLYVADRPIPEEIYVGADEPTHPEVKFWVHDGIIKYKNSQDLWVQSIAYGA